MTNDATRRLELRSAALVVKTRTVLDALVSGRTEGEVDSLVETQREAFNDFSRLCGGVQALEPSTRANIDLVLQLEKEIVAAIEVQRTELVEQDRAITSRVDLAFHTNTPKPPQFITRRV